MVPQQTGRLEVRIVVVLVFTRVGGVGRPAVEGSSRWRPVKVDRGLSLRIIYEAYDDFGSPFDYDGRPGSDSVVADQGSR